MTNNGYTVAVVGATGAVGQQIVTLLETSDIPVKELKLLASARSAGKTVAFKGSEITIAEATPDSFTGVDIALFSAGGSVSKKLAPEAVQRGAVVVDNTSAFRLDPDVPLVVPEVNEADLKNHQGIIANPNCSTIQMVVALEPIRQTYGLKRVIASTYQSVSGAGNSALREMYEQTKNILAGKEVEAHILPTKSDPKHYPIAFNALPQIDQFQENGYTGEEMKMVAETKKIMHLPDLKISVTCVRIPVERGHSESVYFEVEKAGVSVSDIQNVLAEGAGLVLMDNPEEQVYPTPQIAAGKPDTFVGRVRKDLDVDGGFHMWVVADNLLKGAAYNSIQIVQSLIKLDLLKK